MKKLMVITGPTGSGKTDFALKIAGKINDSVIVSADSRQIYKYIQVATCSPKEADQTLLVPQKKLTKKKSNIISLTN